MMSKVEFRIRIDRMDDDHPKEVQYIDIYTIEAKDYDTAEKKAIHRFSVDHGVHKSKFRATLILNNNEQIHLHQGQLAFTF